MHYEGRVWDLTMGMNLRFPRRRSVNGASDWDYMKKTQWTMMNAFSCLIIITISTLKLPRNPCARIPRHEGHQDPCTPRWGLGQDWILGPSFPGCVVFWWPPWCLCQVCSRCFVPVCLYNQSRIVFRHLFPKYYCFFNSDFLSYDFLPILWSNNHR